MYQTETQTLGVSYLDAESWDETFPNMPDIITTNSAQKIICDLRQNLLGGEQLEQALLSLFTPELQNELHIPGQRELTKEELAEVRQAIETRKEARLHHDTSESEYLDYLEKSTGINQKSPDIVEAFDKNTEKAIAHTALAYQHLTEKESHLVSLHDIPSIIAHAFELHFNDLHPWWDFAVSEDVTSKSESNVEGKESAPMFKDKDCPTIFDFFTKVVPKIFEIREKDPKAAMKIFPQSKNVETFNWRISRDKDNNITWIFEWYPGAYTPRDGEDQHHRSVAKNRKISKEQRIVRAIVKFDQDGNAIIGLKPQKDSDGNDIPFAYPDGEVNIDDLFIAANIIGNHDDKIPSNNPFIFIKYLATNPKVRELITRFETVHSQFGNADLVVSGMIGPETMFFIDLDLITPKGEKSDRDYIESLLASNPTPPRFSNTTLLDNLSIAPVVPESELAVLDSTIREFRTNVLELFQIAAEGYIDQNLLTKVITQINLYKSPTTPINIDTLVSRRELEIIKRMQQCIIQPNDLSNETTSRLEKRYQISTKRSQLIRPDHPLTMITPTRKDVNQAIKSRKPINSQNLLAKPKRVADL